MNNKEITESRSCHTFDIKTIIVTIIGWYSAKTFLLIPSYRGTPLYIIKKFGRKEITPANHVKFLGALLNETLSWRFHLVELSRKLASSVGNRNQDNMFL